MATEAIAARTPEREAFYEKIARSNLAPLWERLHGLVTAQPVTALPAGDLALPRCAPLPDAGGRADQRRWRRRAAC